MKYREVARKLKKLAGESPRGRLKSPMGVKKKPGFFEKPGFLLALLLQSRINFAL
jgi:hypothetical protein